jgi:predicted RNA-binding protein YlxR (DUF448 family)
VPRQRKQPLRTCVACRQTGDKRSLLRFVRTPEGAVVCDESGRRAGRGAYLCAEAACFDAARKRRALERALAVRLSAEDYQRLFDEFATLCLNAEHSRGMVENG